MLRGKRGRARAGVSWRKVVWGNGTHNIRSIETLRAPASHFYTPFSFPLTFFFGKGLQYNLARVTFSGAVWAEGFRVAAKQRRQRGESLG